MLLQSTCKTIKKPTKLTKSVRLLCGFVSTLKSDMSGKKHSNKHRNVECFCSCECDCSIIFLYLIIAAVCRLTNKENPVVNVVIRRHRNSLAVDLRQIQRVVPTLYRLNSLSAYRKVSTRFRFLCKFQSNFLKFTVDWVDPAY